MLDLFGLAISSAGVADSVFVARPCLGAATAVGTAVTGPITGPMTGPMTGPLTPGLLIALCVIGGLGTVLLLPGRRDRAIRSMGGVMLAIAGAILAATLVHLTADDARGGMGIYFWVFSILSLASALRVITHPKPVYSALYFILTVFSTAGLFLLLWADFIAVALVLIYAGAILVTYVFVIMLAAEASNPESETKLGALQGVTDHDAVSREPLAACTVGFALMCMILFVVFDKYQAIQSPPLPADIAAQPLTGENLYVNRDLAPGEQPVVHGATQELGAFLFSHQLVNLELAGLILTIAMVGAIIIARKHVIIVEDNLVELKPEVVTGPATPVDDNPHSIPVDGSRNVKLKAFPET